MSPLGVDKVHTIAAGRIAARCGFACASLRAVAWDRRIAGASCTMRLASHRGRGFESPLLHQTFQGRTGSPAASLQRGACTRGCPALVANGDAVRGDIAAKVAASAKRLYATFGCIARAGSTITSGSTACIARKTCTIIVAANSPQLTASRSLTGAIVRPGRVAFKLELRPDGLPCLCQAKSSLNPRCSIYCPVANLTSSTGRSTWFRVHLRHGEMVPGQLYGFHPVAHRPCDTRRRAVSCRRGACRHT